MNLSTVVLLGLAVVWAVVLAPEVLRRVAGMRRPDPVHAFHRQMSSLDRSGARAAGRPARRPAQGRPAARPGSNVVDLRGPASRPAARSAHRPAHRPSVSPVVRKRRQDVLVGLAAAAVLTLLCTVAFGGPFLLLHLVADALLVGYVVLLNRTAGPAPARRPSPLAPYGSTIDLRVGRPAPVSSRRVAN